MKNRQQLDEILAYVADRGITVPADLLLQIGKRDTEELIKALDEISPERLPVYDMTTRGAVPPPLLPDLILGSKGWEKRPVSKQQIVGGGISKNHNLLRNLDYASAGHTGFQANYSILDTLGLLSSAAGYLYNNGSGILSYSTPAQHNAVTLDTNADTILSLSTQALGLDTQTANRVWAGPTTGAVAVPTFRALVADDIPALNYQSPLSFPLAANLGGTGVANLVGSKLTLGGATTISTGGTIALGGFTLTVPATGTAALRSDKLSAFAATTSAELAGVISDETGSGSLVFKEQPTLTNASETCQLLTDAATVTWNTNLGTVAYVKISGNRIIGNPTNIRAGGSYTLYIQQDITGGWQPTWGNAILWDNNKVPVVNTTPFAMSVFGFISDGTYLFGTSATPRVRSITDAVKYKSEVVCYKGEIVYV
jgi:hypothetical protein